MFKVYLLTSCCFDQRQDWFKVETINFFAAAAQNAITNIIIADLYIINLTIVRQVFIILNISAFNVARGHEMERANYLQDLQAKPRYLFIYLLTRSTWFI